MSCIYCMIKADILLAIICNVWDCCYPL